jgi:hypothetical protein
VSCRDTRDFFLPSRKALFFRRFAPVLLRCPAVTVLKLRSGRLNDQIVVIQLFARWLKRKCGNSLLINWRNRDNRPTYRKQFNNRFLRDVNKQIKKWQVEFNVRGVVLGVDHISYNKCVLIDSNRDTLIIFAFYLRSCCLEMD